MRRIGGKSSGLSREYQLRKGKRWDDDDRGEGERVGVKV